MKRLAMLFAIFALGCSHPRQVEVPGTTQIPVDSVVIRSNDGSELAIDFSPLYKKLGHRPSNVVLPPRNYNTFRLAEDKRRIIAYAGSVGYYDIVVGQPNVEKKGGTVAIDWQVDVGAQYVINTVKLVGAPPEVRDQLQREIPFSSGSDIVSAEYRSLRHKLADIIRWHGYSHARVYSRGWIDREKKQLDWYYFVDAGPKTTIASISVVGNHRVPAGDILKRSGLSVGDSYGSRERERAQLRIMDAGSMASVVIVADDDIHKGPPELPDSGGQPRVDANGDMATRPLDAGLHLQISVIEAPRRAVRVEAGVEADSARSDVYAEARTVFRDVGLTGLHLVADGTIAYGATLGEVTEPLGMYGKAKLSVVKASILGVDSRITARLTHTLFPKAAVREYSVGPGIRKSLADKLYLDGQILVYSARETEALALSAIDRASVGLSEEIESAGTKLQTEIVWDDRDSGIEAMRGSFACLQLEYAPDVLGASHEWVSLKTDLRGFRSLSPSVSLAVRGSGSWVLSGSDAGVPLHRRLFGGGAYGFRGFGRQHFSPELNGLLVGGTSMVEGSVEARFLPLRLLYGAVAFVDVGANSVENNPFANGIFAAVGVGARLRTFYIPLSFDLSYRALDESALISPLQGKPWSFFVRLGEAF